jgi:hypothetical protein
LIRVGCLGWAIYDHFLRGRGLRRGRRTGRGHVTFGIDRGLANKNRSGSKNGGKSRRTHLSREGFHFKRVKKTVPKEREDHETNEEEDK